VTPTSTRPSGFDAVADRYDADERANLAFAHMRARSYQRLQQTFAANARLVEIGSGTGTEAAALASRGARIALVDVSPRLLDLAAAKVRAARPGALLGAHLLAAHRVGELTELYGPASFDGGYSSLGPLNCEPALEPIAAGLGALIRPGGSLVLSMMNRLCAVESLWFAAHADWRAAGRRWRGAIPASALAGGPRDIATWYYSRRQIERAFNHAFSVHSAEALPLLWPPTFLDFLVGRHPRLYRALDFIERPLAGLPLLRDLGDHVLLSLRRRIP
jgi:SAM-dependent methyltransferase